MDVASLLKRKPYLHSLFTSYRNPYRFETAKSGERMVVDRRPLASRYAPGEEADRLLSLWRPDRIIVISGAGNPLLLERLLQRRPATQICILIDHRKDLLQFLVQEDTAVADFAATPNCHIFAPDMLESLWSYLAGLPVERFRGVTMIRHPGSLAKAPTFYRDVESRIHGFLKSGLSDLLTRFEFESLWLRNTLLNLRFLPHSPDSPALLAHWKSCWKGPALLVGAGPSLRQSLPLIKALSSHCLIVACDTALKPLLRYGIRPHIVHVLDAQPHTLLHLRGEDLTGTVVFADLVTHPYLLEKLHAPFVFSTTAKYFFDAAGQSVQLQTPGASLAAKQCQEVGALQSGGSVATSAFDLLRYFEASPILLVGTDMAWTGRQLHCVSTHHYEKWAGLQHRLHTLEHINEALLQRRQLEPVESLRGGDIPGDHVLNLYRHWLEESIANLPDLPVWNLTANGANIKGAYRPPKLDAESIVNELKRHGFLAMPSPDHIFTSVPHAKEQRSPILETFLHELASVDPTDEDFFERYPDARALRKKADSYISRNADRLSEERRRAVIEQYAGREIKRLLRWAGGRSRT